MVGVMVRVGGGQRDRMESQPEGRGTGWGRSLRAEGQDGVAA